MRPAALCAGRSVLLPVVTLHGVWDMAGSCATDAVGLARLLVAQTLSWLMSHVMSHHRHILLRYTIYI